MAERRMFARSVIGSARFLKMPATARLLYYDLGMSADDDGIVEAFSVMRTTGSSEDDLRVLASKGFVRVLNEDFVSYILDWEKNNLIRKDRYHPSIYADIKDAECNVLIEPEQTPLHNGQPMVNQRLTEDRLGKGSVVKGSIESTAGKPPTRHRFVPPTVDEVRTYCEEKGYTLDADRFVDYYTFNGWMVGKNRMRDWRAAVRTWCRKEQPANGTTESKPLWTVGTTV